MLLKQLTHPQQQHFLALAAALIAADDRLDPREQRALSALAAEAGLPDAVTPRWQPTDAAQAFDSSASRAVVLVELLGLAHADTCFCDDERAMINDLSEAFGVPALRLGQLESWVVRQLALTAELGALLEAH